MATFTPRFLDEIRSRIVLSEAIGRKVKITRAGREFKACCPFHKEKSPSFYVNDDKNFYHCFGCGAHGDVIGWTMQYENRSFPEAVEQLAMQAGLEMPQQSVAEVKAAREEKNLYQLMEDAAIFMEEELRATQHKGAYDYILARGLTEDTLNAFRVGFASNDRSALHQYLKAKDYTDQQMIECGLIRKDKNGNPYSFFRERIMFPVTDRRGRIVAFGGRILPDSLLAPSSGDFTPPKYINSIDTPLFHKGRMLYGAAHAAYAARENEPLIVTEGYMDVIACWQAGLKGAVAPLGTALTEEQILELWRMDIQDVKVPILCFDGDNAGRRAAQRAAERSLPLLKAGHSLKIIFLPEGEDPDTFIKNKGVKTFQGMLSNALSLVDFLFEQESNGKAFDTPEERANLAKNLEEYAAHITDKDVQYHYRTTFRNKTNQFFRSQRYNNGFQKSGVFITDPTKIVKLQSPNQNQQNLIQRILLAAVILYPELFNDVEERLGSLHLSHQALVNIRSALFAHIESIESNKDANQIKLDSAALKSHLISVGLEGDLFYTLNDSVLTHAGFLKETLEYHDLLQHWETYWALMEQ